MNNYKDNNKLKFKALKIWVGLIVIITMIYVMISFLGYDYYEQSDFDIRGRKYLRTITPAYPPPLVNFI